jgi:hypothetical protein
MIFPSIENGKPAAFSKKDKRSLKAKKFYGPS